MFSSVYADSFRKTLRNDTHKNNEPPAAASYPGTIYLMTLVALITAKTNSNKLQRRKKPHQQERDIARGLFKRSPCARAWLSHSLESFCNEFSRKPRIHIYHHFYFREKTRMNGELCHAQVLFCSSPPAGLRFPEGRRKLWQKCKLNIDRPVGRSAGDG